MRRVAASRRLPLALVGVVVLLDLALARTAFDPVRTAVLDEPAHLLTTAIVLLSVAPRWCARRPGEALVVLVSSVAIDLDHLPRLLGPEGGVAGSRPPTHSLATVAGLLLLAFVVRRSSRAQRLVLAASAGVALHLVRDLGSGPGVPLFWPVSGHEVGVDHTVYLGVLAALAVHRALSATRPSRARRTGGPR